MSRPWIDDLAVLLWPWTVKDGTILPPVKRRRRKDRNGVQAGEDEAGDDNDGGGHDQDAERRPRPSGRG